MRMPSIGREYAKFPVNVDADIPLEVSFDGGVTWTDMERPNDNTARVLVSGPLSEDDPVGTVRLKVGQNYATVRLTANPETVARTAGSIYVFNLK